MAPKLIETKFFRRGKTIRFLLALVLTLPLVAGIAAAEPYMTVREGYKCSKCHTNHTGGGKRTDYAQVYMQSRMAAGQVVPQSADEVVAWDSSNGKLNEFFSVGADLRTSYSVVSPFEGSDTHQFNRPAACAACHEATGGGGKLAEVYAQMIAVPGKASIVASQNLKPTVSSREFYGIMEDLALDGYFKVGTFRLPTGLQNTHDDPFAHGVGRLNYGFNGVVGVESVRGEGVEFGIEPGPFAVAFSVTNSVDPSGVPRDDRISLMAYAVGSPGMIGVNFADNPITETVTITTVSAYGGISLGRITGLLHMDRIETEDSSNATKLRRKTGLAEADILVGKGLNLKLLYEFIDPDADTLADTVDRYSIIFEPFIRSYLQFRAGYRDYTGPKGEETSNFNTYFIETHFLF